MKHEKKNLRRGETCDDSIVNLYRKNAQAVKVMIMDLLEFVTREVK